MKETQSTQILNHMEKFGSITSMDAFRNYNCTRLAARISDLRKSGHIIISERETNNGKSYARYTLVE